MKRQQANILQLFPEYKPPKSLCEYFEGTYIKKVSAQQDLAIIHFYLEATYLIHYQYIAQLEKELLPHIQMREEAIVKGVKIHIHYQLPKRYTLEVILEEYWNSILYEIKSLDIINYLAINQYGYKINKDKLELLFPDSSIVMLRSREITNFIKERLEESFDLHILVTEIFVAEDYQALKEKHQNQYKEELANRNTQIDRLNKLAKEEFKPEKEDEEDQADSAKHHEQGEVAEKTENNDSSKAKKEKVQRKDTGTQNKDQYSNRKEKSIDSGYTKSGVASHSAAGEVKPRENTYRRRSKLHCSEDPEIFYGMHCNGELIHIADIDSDNLEVCIRGQIIKLENREIRGERTIVSFNITDFTDTITGKIFIENAQLEELELELSIGGFYTINAITQFDNFSHELSLGTINGIKKSNDFRPKRVDDSIEKRVELHVHTTMSDKDSVCDVQAIIKRAGAWGHKAIAITDHGVVQAFPKASAAGSKIDNFKVIYGVEGYFVDDLKDFIIRSKGQNLQDSYVVFDIETTGKNIKFHKITEISAVKIEGGKITQRFTSLVNPERNIPYQITVLTGIRQDMVADQPTIDKVLPEFFEFCKDSVLVAHNASFDTGFIAKEAKDLNLPFDFTIADTLGMARVLLPHLGKFKLDRICKELKIVLTNHHRAAADAEATAEIFIRFIAMLNERGITNLDQLNSLGAESKDSIKKSTRYHGIILAKNEIGRVNLYRLVSLSHLEYFNRFPLIPKSLINKYREGLIIGSACASGELYKAILDGADALEIQRIVDFYDYLEIQPIGNNSFMIESDSYEVSNEEDLREHNRTIVALGEQYNKPVVATCDVHFLDPKDAINRALIKYSEKYKDYDDQPPLYFRTTNEMLKEFEYLGMDKAREVVITNSNLIADMIEFIKPVRPDKCPPIIDNSDETLTQICYERAHKIYGPDLPEMVESRLKRELDSIISNGFAVMYITAQKLVWDSNDHQYLVGSRGSVGSSFVATMSGITEVNPLSAHYICPSCYYSDFDSPEVKAFSGNSGCDMPNKNCPKCGHLMMKEGHDIPFETFLGFKGNKEPDIDLNFSGEYQSSAHQFTEYLFGKENAFRAGTVGSIKENTAFGIVKGYLEEKGIVKRKCEIERIGAGIVGVKRTTGQHPGGMIVLPRNEEIYSFTPIQRPANDQQSNIITTHFEYHSIDHNLLKLDILGHDDPTMIRRLEDLTGVSYDKIPLDDKKTLSMFQTTDALGIKPEDMDGVPLASLGVPEFGTEFAMQLLIDAKPTMFSDLVRISGLSHGTGVWLGNAKDLIDSGTAIISTAICCRDDIMVYLIHMGLDNELSFTIMESVRKGKGLTPQFEEAMRKVNVPEWYIESCKKIQYMFPKAHAAAYVMMGWRIAWYKLYYPLEYYAAFYSIRMKNFNYEKMCMGKENLLYHMDMLKKDMAEKAAARKKKEKKDEEMLREMHIVLEMYARGFEFVSIDIYVADASRCKIVDGKIMPPFNCIDGFGTAAAEQLQQAAAKAKERGGFTSLQNIRDMAKVGKSATDKLVQHNIIQNLPETDQISLFDFMDMG